MPESRYREVTTASIVFGIVVGAIMNASITYAGLKIGFTIGGSAIAAVLGFGVLRGILRRGSILETNIAQTIASAVNVPNSGVIFTVPVLLLLGYKLSIDGASFWLITLACVAGSVLGCAFIIPVRKQMLDIDRLRFPTGTAVAAILKAPGAGSKKSIVLAAGAVVAALIYFPVVAPSLGDFGPPGDQWRLYGYADLNWRLSAPAPAKPNNAEDAQRNAAEMRRVDHDGDGQPDLILTNEAIDVGRALGFKDYLLFVFAITPLSFGAGFVTGRAGLVVLAGGVLAYWVINPAAYLMDLMPATLVEHEVPDYGHKAFNRPMGIGMLLGGAMMGVLFALPAIRAAVKSIAGATRSRSSGDELGLKVLVVAVVLCGVGLAFAADMMHSADVILQPDDVKQGEFNPPPANQGGNAGGGWLEDLNPHLQSLIVAIVGVVWIWFAGIIIAQCTGMTDWSPISGMALITVVLVMALAGTGHVLGAVLIGAALCVAVTCAADMMQDLKTGYLLGAKPIRQQVVELLATGIGPVISMLTILLIAKSAASQGFAIGDEHIPAPQAKALKAVIEGVQGGAMPYALYGCGALLGVALGLGSFAGLGVLVGLSMYLPLEYVLTYGLGCLANMLVARVKGKQWTEEWGVPFCAGLIVGEAVLALAVNAIVLVRG